MTPFTFSKVDFAFRRCNGSKAIDADGIKCSVFILAMRVILTWSKAHLHIPPEEDSPDS